MWLWETGSACSFLLVSAMEPPLVLRDKPGWRTAHSSGGHLWPFRHQVAVLSHVVLTCCGFGRQRPWGQVKVNRRTRSEGDPSSRNRSIKSALNSCMKVKEMRKWTSGFSFILLSKGYNYLLSYNNLELSIFFVVCLCSFFFLNIPWSICQVSPSPEWEHAPHSSSRPGRQETPTTRLLGTWGNNGGKSTIFLMTLASRFGPWKYMKTEKHVI